MDLLTIKAYYKLIVNETIGSIEPHKKFVNWVIGEFDLYLKNNDSKELKVYFPNGWFSIESFIDKEERVNIEIKVRAKSRIVCDMMMKQIENIYKHFIRFHDV